MPKENKMRSTQNNKKSDGNFRSKKIKHDPQAESARAVNKDGHILNYGAFGQPVSKQNEKERIL